MRVVWIKSFWDATTTGEDALNRCESSRMRVEEGAEHDNQSVSVRNSREGRAAIFEVLGALWVPQTLLSIELCCHTVVKILHYILQVQSAKHWTDKEEADFTLLPQKSNTRQALYGNVCLLVISCDLILLKKVTSLDCMFANVTFILCVQQWRF